MANASLRPKPFDGSPTQDINEFLEAFERYSQFADWTPIKKARGLKTMLTEKASKWLTRQAFDEDIGYDDLADSLRQKYQITVAQQFQIRSELSTIKQKNSESVAEYAERVEQLANKVDVIDPERTHIFLQGLKGTIKLHAIRVQPANFQDAVEAALAEEGAQSLSKSPTDSHDVVDIDLLADKLAKKLGLNPEVTANVKKVSANPPPVPRCQMCQVEGHEAPQCPKFFSPTRMPPGTVCQFCRSPSHIAPQCSSWGPPQTQYRPPRRPRRDRSQIQCFNCGNWGHYQNECQAASSKPLNQGNDHGPAQLQ